MASHEKSGLCNIYTDTLSYTVRNFHPLQQIIINKNAYSVQQDLIIVYLSFSVCRRIKII